MMVDPSDLLWLALAILLMPFVFGAVSLVIEWTSPDATQHGGPDDA